MFTYKITIRAPVLWTKKNWDAQKFILEEFLKKKKKAVNQKDSIIKQV